ncbi:MAG: GNAT family N-acetyltransferase [Clostridia bacterium]
MEIREVEFVNLKDRIEYLEEVSKLYWKQWSEEKGDTLEGVLYRTKHCLKEKDIPQTYIAIYQNKLVGIVSLWRNDLCARQDLYPWLAGLYVKEEYREKGIGTFLQNKAIESSRKLGYEKLYLITNHENYYEKNGWKFLEKAPLGNGTLVKIYEYSLKK